jgi:uncharacterized protein (DUF1810 family)
MRPVVGRVAVGDPRDGHRSGATGAAHGFGLILGDRAVTRQEMTVAHAYDLERFVGAQEADGTYDRAVEELRRGRKTSHWMWYVFPQIAGLGYSATSRRYAIASLEEAQAYLEHPVLGPRMKECAGIVAQTQGQSAEQIFGGIDARKLHSSMTLFMRAAPDEPLYKQVLDQYFGGRADAATDQRI